MRPRFGAIVVALGTTLAGAAAHAAQSGYAAVNGLSMYYEIHGAGRPLVLLHGALMTIEGLRGAAAVPCHDAAGHCGRAAGARAHRRYRAPVRLRADGGRHRRAAPGARHRAGGLLRLQHGKSIALQIAIRHPALVRKLVLAASAFDPDGFYPEVLENIRNLKPEDFAGSPWLQGYARVAPDPEGWPTLLAKAQQLVGGFEGWPADAIRTIEAPALVVVADSDVVRPEHAVELFRLLGGGIAGDLGGLPRSQLAVLPGTTHVSLVERADWLTPMVSEFLDAPLPEAK